MELLKKLELDDVVVAVRAIVSQGFEYNRWRWIFLRIVQHLSLGLSRERLPKYVSHRSRRHS